MRVPARTRALAILAASASLIAVPLASPASAAAGAQCKKASETTAGGKITFHVSQCTPTAATGGSGQGPVTNSKPGQTSGTLNVKVTWAQHKGTTSAQIHFKTEATRRRCPVGASRLTITGKVTNGTGTAFKTIKKNQPVSGSVCLKTVGTKTTITIEPQTVIKF